MPLTNEVKVALDTLTAALDAPPVVAAPATPWFLDTSSPAPTVPLTDLNDVAEIKRYMAHGLRPNLTRGVAESDWAKYLNFARAVYTAPTPQIANMLIRNSGELDPDVAVYAILGGGTQGGMFGPLEIFASQATIPNLTAAAAWMTGVPDPNGPGASGR